MRVSPNLGPRLLSIGLVAIILAVPAVGAGSAPVRIALAHAGPATFHGKSAPTTVQSTNWAGWAVSAGSKTVTDVKGSWIVPKIQGSCPSSYQYSSFWIGIDGYSASSVEQIGTDSDCQGGSPTYYAWFEFYPNPSHYISTLTIHPGNIVSAEVHFTGSKFTVTLKDLNTSKSFTKSASVTASRSSAEWIAEAPASSSGVLPLADFGKVHFGPDATNVTGSGKATISGSTKAIGAFSGAVEITMINNHGTATKASPSPLSPNGSSFNVTWASAGP
jgi:hypothetical protein